MIDLLTDWIKIESLFYKKSLCDWNRLKHGLGFINGFHIFFFRYRIGNYSSSWLDVNLLIFDNRCADANTGIMVPVIAKIA